MYIANSLHHEDVEKVLITLGEISQDIELGKIIHLVIKQTDNPYRHSVWLVPENEAGREFLAELMRDGIFNIGLSMPFIRNED